MRMSNFLIATVLVMLVMTVFGLFFANVNQESTLTTSNYDNTSLRSYERLERMQNISNDLQDSVENETQKNVIDIIGSFITRAKSTIDISFESVGLVNDMTADAQKKLGLPGIFSMAIGMIIIISIVFLVVSVWVKYRT